MKSESFRSVSERGWAADLVPVLLFFLLPALPLSTFGLPARDAPLFALRNVIALLLDRAQDSGTRNLLPESLKQAMLRLSWSELNLSQPLFTSFQSILTLQTPSRLPGSGTRDAQVRVGQDSQPIRIDRLTTPLADAVRALADP